jgi:hypothetical protein
MTKWTTYLVAVLMALGFAIPAGAQGKGQYARVLGERAQAGAALSEQVERARARSEMESALTARGEALNDLMAASRPVAAHSADGFDWRAAGSGAGVTLVLVLGAFGIAFLARRSRHAMSEAA